MLRRDPIQCDVELCNLIDYTERLSVPVASLGHLYRFKVALSTARFWHIMGHLELAETYLYEALKSAMYVRMTCGQHQNRSK